MADCTGRCAKSGVRIAARTTAIVSLSLLVAASAFAQVAPAAAPSEMPESATQAWPDRTILPIRQPTFSGTIRETMPASTPMPHRPVRPPEGAPNIFLLMADDVGFSMSSTFGGPVPTPNMDRLAQRGQRYNRFHSAGVCSPSRAALLTGRNPHRVGTGHIADLAAGYPGYNARFPASAATIAQTLRFNGYNTAMFGKHHNIPPGETTDAGPFDMWPTGLGFEYFFGFPNGESDQIHPNVYRGTNRLAAPSGQPEFFEKRMADDTMRWVRNHVAAAPDKPFFIYYSPGSTHAPHQAPPELIAKFRGQFDQGWDKLRKETWRRQVEQGIIPKDAKLTPRPDSIPAWDTIKGSDRAFALRGMEVAAAMLAYQDEQLGRVLDEMERTGVLEDTLVIVIQGDNGASGDGDEVGLTDEMLALNFVQESEEDRAASIERLGGQYSHGSYAEGWGWAMNAPFQWYKARAGMLGALRDGMIVSWKGRISEPGTVCDRFGHLVDIAPTLLDAAGIPAPASVNGVQQTGYDGASLLDSFENCEGGKSRTQYFEVGGKAGLYSDGWMISSANNALGHLSAEGGGKGIDDPDAWLLFDLRGDFSQSRDISKRFPAKRDELFALWRKEAMRNNVLPVRSGFVPMNSASDPRKRYDFWGKDVSIPAHPDGLMAIHLNRAFTLTAEIEVPDEGTSGVIMALGSWFSGWSLFLDEGHPVFHLARSIRPGDAARLESTTPLPTGANRLELRFNTEGPGRPAEVEIRANGNRVAKGAFPSNIVMPLGVGENLDAGRDTGVPVTAYSSPEGLFEGEIRHVSIEFD